MRRKDLGNVIVKKAIMLAMAFMMGITTLGSNVITARADEASDAVVATAEEAKAAANVVVEDVTINGLDQENEETNVDLKSNDIVESLTAVENDLKAAGEAYDAINADVTSNVKTVNDDAAKVSDATDAAADEMTEEVIDNLDDAIDNADAKLAAGINTVAEADALISELTTTSTAAQKEYDAASAELSKAIDAVDEARDAYNKAVAAVDANREEVKALKKALDDADADMKAAVAACEATKARVDAVNQMLVVAGDVLTDCYVAPDAQAKLDEATAMMAEYEKNTDAEAAASVIAQYDILFGKVDENGEVVVKGAVPSLKDAATECAVSQAVLDAMHENANAQAVLGNLYNAPYKPGNFVAENAEAIGLINAEDFIDSFNALGKEDATVEERVKAMKAIAILAGAPEEMVDSDPIVADFTEAYLYTGTEDEVLAYRHQYVMAWIDCAAKNMDSLNAVYAVVENAIDFMVEADKADADTATFEKTVLDAVEAFLGLDCNTRQQALSAIAGMKYLIEAEGALNDKLEAATTKVTDTKTQLEALKLTCPTVEEVKAAMKAWTDAETEYKFVAADVQYYKEQIDEAGKRIAAINVRKASITPAVTPTTPTTPTTPAGGTTPATVATVTTPAVAAQAPVARRQAAAVVADANDNGDVEIVDDQTPLATEEVEAEEVVEDEEIVEIGDEDIPEAVETKKLSWWWLIIVAIIAATGVITRIVMKKKAAKKVK